MNYFSLVISTFPSTFSHHSPQAEICISSNSSCWTLKPPLKWGCSLQCFTLSHKTDDCISHTAQGSQHRQPGSSLQQRCWAAACLSAPRDTVHPRTYGLVVGCDHGFQHRLECPGQERDGVWQGVGSAEGQVQHSLCCRPWPAGQRWYLTYFPTSAQDLHACMKAGDARELLGYCINREQAVALPPGYSTVQISPQHASPTRQGAAGLAGQEGAL